MLLKTKRKIVLMILFSFEVEPKPLVWESVTFSKRFDFVNPDKIMHVVANDERNAEWPDNEW